MQKQRGLVLYGSRYGSTQKYAQALAARLGFDCLDCRQATGREASEYPVLVYGGGLYAGGVKGLKQTLRRMGQPGRAKWFFFTVGIADPSIPCNRDHICQGLYQQIPSGLFQPERVFHLRGALDYHVLSPAHRAMMWALAQQIKRRPAGQRTKEDEQVLETYGKRVDYVDLTTLEPLFQAVAASFRDFNA